MTSSRLGRLALLTARRAISFVVLALGVTLILFVLTHVVPGDPAGIVLGPDASADPATVAAFREKYGLNKPLPEQYLIYVSNLARGDLGRSLRTSRPVSQDLLAAVPATIELATVAIVISVILGMSLGVIAAIDHDGLADQIVRVVSLASLSAPTFWVALGAYYIFYFQLGWAPSGGRLEAIATPPPFRTGLYTVDSLIAGRPDLFVDSVRHLVMPALVLSHASFAFIARFARANVLDVLQSEYVLMARAKGLPESQVILRYVVRAALVPIVTLLGVIFAGLLAGAVFTETIFSWPGVGRYAYLSAGNLDVNAIVGVSLFVGLTYVVVNFVVDLLAGMIDPRIHAG